jgi:hypothetical protein
LAPGFDGFEFIEGAAFVGEDDCSRLGPSIGFGAGVVAQEIVVDRLFQLGDAGECAPPNALARDLRVSAS